MTAVEQEQSFLPVEIILKEDEYTVSTMQSVYSMTPRERIRQKRKDPEYREKERVRQRLAMQLRRQDPTYVMAERQSQRWRMQLRRSDPQFREKERLKQRERMQIRRLDPQMKKKERLAQKTRRINALDRTSLTLFLEKPSDAYQTESQNKLFDSLDQLNSSGIGLEKDGFDGLNDFIRTELILSNIPQPTALSNVKTWDSKKPLPTPPDLLGCPTCGLLFQSRLSLRLHRKKHQTALICEICDKTYNDRSSLSRHIKRHSERYECSECGKVFHMKQHLKEHSKSHGEKGLLCPHCDYKTCYKYALKRHMNNKHHNI